MDNVKPLHPGVKLENDSLQNYLNRLGTEVDPGVAARPVWDDPLTQYELETLYRRNDLAARLIDEIVDEALVEDLRIVDKSTGREVELPAKLKLTARVRRAAKDGRAFGAGAVVLFPASGADLWVPASPGEEIAAAITLDRYEMQPLDDVVDPLDPHFGEPEYYRLFPQTSGSSITDLPIVHHSRMLMFYGHKTSRRLRSDYDRFPDSILDLVWPPLRNLVTAEQSFSTLINRFETATISIAGLSAIQSAPDGGDLIAKRFDLIHRSISTLNAALIDADAGEKYERKFAQVSGLDTLYDRLAHAVARAGGYSMTKLFGMSPSGLSTDDESGRAHWKQTVIGYRRDALLPALEQLGELFNGGNPVEVLFAPVEELTPAQEAEVAAKRANTRQVYYQTGLLEDARFTAVLKKEGTLPDDFEVDQERFDVAREAALQLREERAGWNENEEDLPPKGDDEEE
jgi:phage-related protein (TIGR01555 family)